MNNDETIQDVMSWVNDAVSEVSPLEGTPRNELKDNLEPSPHDPEPQLQVVELEGRESGDEFPWPMFPWVRF